MSGKVNKVLVMLLCFVMVAAMVAGCGQKQGDGVTTENGSTKAESSEKTSQQEELIKERKLSIITTPAGANFPDGVSIDNSKWFTFIEEKTGYDLEWTLFKKGSTVDEQLMILLASGNAPDLIQVDGGSQVLTSIVKNGGVSAIDDAWSKYANNLKKMVPQEVLDIFKIDGKHWYIPRYAPVRGIGTMAVRKDWLDELGLKVPVTIDDYYNVLVQFKKAKPDMIPLIAAGKEKYSSFYRFIHLAGAFGIYSNEKLDFYFAESGKVEFSILTEKGKSFLKTMNKWYNEGLIDREYLLEKQPIEKMIAGQGGMGHWNKVEKVRQTGAFEKKNPGAELVYIAPPVGANGEQGYLQQKAKGMAFFVPQTSEKKVYAAVDFLEKCTENGIYDAICYGFEGEHYTKNGSEIVLDEEKLTQDAYMGYYSRLTLDNSYGEVWYKIFEGGTEAVVFADSFGKDNAILMVPMTLETYNKKISELSKFVEDSIMRFIVEGFTDVEFDKLVEDFNTRGGKECAEELQKWYDSK